MSASLPQRWVDKEDLIVARVVLNGIHGMPVFWRSSALKSRSKPT
jgi:hypothetical protein